ncbi:phage tail assembly protein [Breoghania sp.]|uniref:phage tail assembly protein n=1 Tax=Breoghania sp. TaxID=2065378 RepID=UPI0029CA0B40|nr:phage tail assembly protein [Breoghania sp.]
MSDLKLTIDIPLSVPAEERDGDKTKRHNSLTMSRPRTRHVRRVVSLLGQEFVQNLMAGAGGSEGADPAAAMSGRDMLAEALGLLVAPERLEGLRDVLADLCGVSPDVIDDVDPTDMVKVVEALAGFFPALRSLASMSS